MNRTDRLYALVEELRARAPRYATAPELASHFEVSVRTIERDISALQQSGVPIWASPGRNGGYTIDPQRTLPPLNLTGDEAASIATALAAGGSMPFAKAGRSALLKVLAAMASTDATAATDLAGRIHVAPPSPLQSEVLKNVEVAVANGQVVRLHYRDRAGQLSERDVEAHGIAGGRGGWYLVAWCRTRDEARNFRLDRIISAEPTEERISPREIDDLMTGILGPVSRPVTELISPEGDKARVDKKRLLALIERERSRWDRLIQRARPVFEEPGVSGDWSVKEIVGHVAQLERWHLGQFRALVDGGRMPEPEEIYGSWTYPAEYDNPAISWGRREEIALELSRGRTSKEILEESASVFAELLSWLRDIDDEWLSAVVGMSDGDPGKPGGGRVLRRFSQTNRYSMPSPLWRWACVFKHYHEHQKDIEQWLEKKNL